MSNKIWKVEKRREDFVVTDGQGSETNSTENKIVARSAMRVLNEKNVTPDSDEFQEFDIEWVEKLVQEELEKLSEPS